MLCLCCSLYTFKYLKKTNVPRFENNQSGYSEMKLKWCNKNLWGVLFYFVAERRKNILEEWCNNLPTNTNYINKEDFFLAKKEKICIGTRVQDDDDIWTPPFLTSSFSLLLYISHFLKYSYRSLSSRLFNPFTRLECRIWKRQCILSFNQLSWGKEMY